MSAPERWKSFLSQIAARHEAVLGEGFGAAEAVLAGPSLDVPALMVSLGAVRLRLQELETRIIDTWNEKVEATFEAEGIPHAQEALARREGELLGRALERKREKLEPYVLARAAHRLQELAVASPARFACSSCGASHEPARTYRAVEIRCPSCGVAGVFEPGPLLRQVESTGAHAIGWVEAEQEWNAMKDAEDALRDTRSPAPLALLVAYEEAQIAYWYRYFSAQGRLVPEVARDLEKFVRSRLETWYTMTAEHEENWRAAGRPRKLPPP